MLYGGGQCLGHPGVVGRPPLLSARGGGKVSEFGALRGFGISFPKLCFGPLFCDGGPWRGQNKVHMCLDRALPFGMIRCSLCSDVARRWEAFRQWL